jgi:3-oxoacyl-[acyl-carrier protein] reductase
MDLGLAGRVYLVTGGSKGLGFATAKALVDDGARVVLSSRSQQNVDAAVAELGENAIGVAGDNADTELAERMVSAATARFGRLDGLLVSVGGPPVGDVLDSSEQAWSDAFSSIFLGTLRLVRRVVEELGEGGVIGLVLSTSVREPLDHLAISNGLRPGLAGVAKTLSNEVGPRGIRVVSLMPGSIRTGRSAAVFADPATLAKRTESIALRRLGEPEEFGRAAAFLLSPAASYVTGTVVAIDGGAIKAL